MRKAPSSSRVHIALFGRRNVGKSSLVNALAGHSVSLVSPEPGTTTDPVKKALELPTIGPAVLIDSAGLDDKGTLGLARVSRTRRLLGRTDIGIVVAIGASFGVIEESLLVDLEKRGCPSVIVFNKVDAVLPDSRIVKRWRNKGIPVVLTSAKSKRGIDALSLCLDSLVPREAAVRPMIADLLRDHGKAVLVVPIDREAPKGRLILPQVQLLREILDNDLTGIVVGADRVADALCDLRSPPDLVVTDSQVLGRVSEVTPPSVRLTTFSVLMSRVKGDPQLQRAGALAIDHLKPGARVLVAEACAHHTTDEDIGKFKIPRWVAARTRHRVRFDHVHGRDLPDDFGRYDLVIHCGACTWNRRQMLTRLTECQEAGTPVTNYGMAIAHCLGLLDRVLEPLGLTGHINGARCGT